MEPMCDPELRELEEGLMRAGRDVKMSPALQAKTLTALGIGAAGVTAAAGAKAGTLGWLSSKGGALLGIGLAGGATVVGAYVVGTALSGEPEPVEPVAEPVVSHVVAPQEPAASALEEEAAVELDPDTWEEEAVEEEPAPEQVADQPKVIKRAPVVTKVPSLGEELEFIARAESALRAGNPQAALTHLATYRQKVEKRRLGLEAEVLTIQALYESGSVAAARSRAESFIKRHPKSPLGVRAKQYLQ